MDLLRHDFFINKIKLIFGFYLSFYSALQVNYNLFINEIRYGKLYEDFK